MLSLVFRDSSLGGHLVQVSLKSCHFTLHLPFGSRDCLVETGLFTKALICVRQFLLNHAPSPVCLLQQSASFLQCILVGVCSLFSSKEIIVSNGLGMLLLFKLSLSISEGCLIIFYRFLGLSIGRICMLKACFKIKNIGFQFLFHSNGFSLCFSFSFYSSLQIFKGFIHIFPCGCKFIIFLLKTSVYLLLHLSQLKLQPQSLIFLLLKGTFCLRKSSLKLKLFSLKSLTCFIDGMNRVSTFCYLVHDIFNFIGEIFVFSPNFFELKNNFFVGRLDLKKF